VETEPLEPLAERPNPGDVTAAETRLMWRRLLLGLAIAVSVNIAFLTGGAAVANYLIQVFRPYFYHDKTVYVVLQAPPSPSPTPSPSASPASDFQLR